MRLKHKSSRISQRCGGGGGGGGGSAGALALALADPRGCQGCIPPLVVLILSFSCSFQQKSCPPLPGNTRSAIGKGITYNMSHFAKVSSKTIKNLSRYSGACVIEVKTYGCGPLCQLSHKNDPCCEGFKQNC